MPDSEMLQGGNSNVVVKQGDTVVRNTRAWSPFVHHLLRSLTEAGFTESPVLLESGDGKERLSFIQGTVGNYPLEPYMQTDDILVEAARLLRKLHDTTQNFRLPPDVITLLPLRPDMAHEVICHNDFAPYNCVFREGHLAGIIDFDTASPGSRLWDIAYAVYRFAPLTNDIHSGYCGWSPIPDRGRRLKLFCDAYGLEHRADLLPTVIKRLEALVAWIEANFTNLEHVPIYKADIQYIREQMPALTQALT